MVYFWILLMDVFSITGFATMFFICGATGLLLLVLTAVTALIIIGYTSYLLCAAPKDDSEQAFI